MEHHDKQRLMSLAIEALGILTKYRIPPNVDRPQDPVTVGDEDRSTAHKLPDIVQREIDTGNLPPKLAALIANSPEMKRQCPECGMLLEGGRCVECSITPAS